jgi:serine protease Do
MRSFWLASLLLAVSVVAAPAIGHAQAARETPTSKAQVQLSFSAVAKKASPAVVNVYAQRVVVERAPMFNDPVLRQFGLGMGVPQERVQKSLGSGVLVRADGVIITNHHVIENADQLKVVLNDRREFDAKVLLDDPHTDLAVLRIDTKGEKLPVLDFADTHSLQVGDLVLAIGNPFGLTQTVTSGIVSAVGRTEVSINDYSSFIQTDAAINKGNSGGALVNMDGELVGVNSAIFSEGGGSNGIGFAIPSEMAKSVMDAAFTGGGKVVRPWLGVKGQPVTQQTAKTLGLPSPKGMMISDVYPNSPAAKAGLVKGDVVLSINGAEVFDEGGVRYQAATMRPGAAMTIDVIKGNARRQVSARAEAPPRDPAPDMRTLQGAIPLAGTQVANLSPAEAEEVGFDTFASGVYIKGIQPSGVAARLGLRPGDIIRDVNGKPTRTSAELANVLRTPAQHWVVGVERAGRRLELQI